MLDLLEQGRRLVAYIDTLQAAQANQYTTVEPMFDVMNDHAVDHLLPILGYENKPATYYRGYPQGPTTYWQDADYSIKHARDYITAGVRSDLPPF